MAGGGGGTTAAEKLIVDAQKSTNQLKDLLAKLLPRAEEGGGAVEAILSHMSESLSQALASLQRGASTGDRRLPVPPEASLSSHGQSVQNSGGRLVSTRSGQRRSRADGSSHRIILQHGARGDSYLWRKYGQKDILGARFARSYFKCGQRAGCPARKQVQQSDADPSRLEITYIGAHTCHELPSPSCATPAANSIDDDTRRNTTSHRRLPAAVAVPSTMQTLEDHVLASDMTAWTPSMEQEISSPSWLFIPSPACSQSELLSVAEAEAEAEVPELQPDALTAPVEHKKARDWERFVHIQLQSDLGADKWVSTSSNRNDEFLVPESP
ncbi:hypothetical protein GUJ93_ZPchr0151g33455 [Zizania palustris]|uniref:WRKY domain-containing protein n=1 Tax=Zizania palustris TaxID=103762 RepID=A0A8J5R2I7_ZIZPA|nr:hypothetical protein GUJ93_ZPchr0151g33455 [Zizania palustris]